MITALFTGDSITDAGRVTDPSGGLGAGYVRRIGELAADAGARITLVNTGISGNRAVDLAARWDEDVIAFQPDVLTILVGINDTWRRYDPVPDETPAETFAKTYSTLVERALAGCELRGLVIMEPFVLPVSKSQARWPAQDLDAKRSAARDVAALCDATFVPLQDILAAQAAKLGPAALAYDGVHPTAIGHELIARAWWEHVGERVSLK